MWVQLLGFRSGVRGQVKERGYVYAGECVCVCVITDLRSKHTRLHLLRDDEDRLIQTVLHKAERRDEDGRVAAFTERGRRERERGRRGEREEREGRGKREERER